MSSSPYVGCRDYFIFYFLSRLHTHREAQDRARTHDPEDKTRAEIKSQMLNQLSHPRTLENDLKKKKKKKKKKKN